MAINKNHLFDDLNGIKCAIVESGITPERAEFLKSLLQHNGYEVVVVSAPPPKGAPAVAEGETAAPPADEKFVLGVTDVTFNVINAVYGRLLKSIEGRVVTMAYWQQKETISDDTVPYFDYE